MVGIQEPLLKFLSSIRGLLSSPFRKKLISSPTLSTEAELTLFPYLMDRLLEEKAVSIRVATSGDADNLFRLHGQFLLDLAKLDRPGRLEVSSIAELRVLLDDEEDDGNALLFTRRLEIEETVGYIYTYTEKFCGRESLYVGGSTSL